MKVLLYFLIAIVFISGCTASRVYIVRHAEKSEDPPNDPHLTAAGSKRAEALASVLRDKKIKSIYSTPTNRTIETAMPFSRASGMPIQYYKNDTLAKFLYRILDSGKNALIIGHSNSVILMIEDLQLKHAIKEIPDNDYDNLFIVQLKRKTPAGYKMKLKETVYGERSPALGDTSRPAMTSKYP